MRTLWMLVIAALLSTACSSSVEPVDAAPVTGEESGERSVGEPLDDRGVGPGGSPGHEGRHRDAAEARAFDEPDSGQASVPRSDPAGPQDALLDDGLEDVTVEEGNPPSEPTELSAIIDELIPFVEAARGHRFTTRPDVVLLDGEAFTNAWNELVEDDAMEYAEDYANFTDIYRAMGVLENDQTLEEIWKRFGDAGVLGYYDSERQGIVLRSGEITAFTKTVLVHELVHALDDQIFDIERDEYHARDDEIGWTFSALVEGSAGWVEERYRDTLGSAEREEEVAVQRSLPRTVSLSEFNTSFLELQFGRYRYGDAFVATLWGQGRSAVDRAFENPPPTSEAVLDPALYLAGAEQDGAVDLPIGDGTVFESGIWGEAAWAAVFADVFGRVEALDLANGWGGDSFVAWRSGGDVCVRANIEGDSPESLDNYAFALERWSQAAGGREIFYPTADIIRVTSCV